MECKKAKNKTEVKYKKNVKDKHVKDEKDKMDFKELLTGSIGTEEGGFVPTRCAHVEGLGEGIWGNISQIEEYHM